MLSFLEGKLHNAKQQNIKLAALTVLWFGYNMFSQDSCAKGSIFNATMFRSRALGKHLAHDGCVVSVFTWEIGLWGCFGVFFPLDY